jgi:hypothetical protein
MEQRTMGQERLSAFIDAVIAIIMTILVLELDKPKTLDWQGLWELRENFFAYALSFFWLGAMWVNLHAYSHRTEKITQKTVWAAMVMLFFASLFPYATNLIAMDFYNATVQVFYGIIVLLITAATLVFYRTVSEVNPSEEFRQMSEKRSRWIKWDILLKIIGLICSLTIFPIGTSLAVFITLCGLVIPNQFRN